jgi:hypothetical protein
MMMNNPDVSPSYGSLTQNKFPMKSVSTLKEHDVYSNYASLPRLLIEIC